MGSSYETCRGNATQDKRSGRRTAWATSDDFGRINRTGHLSGGAPPKTGWADGGAHGRILTMARGRRQGWLGWLLDAHHHRRPGLVRNCARGPGPIATKLSLAKTRSGGSPQPQNPVVMGPCVLEVCGGREAVGSLALDAVSRRGLPPVPSINLN